MNSNQTFFLGGLDAEMTTIRQILSERQLRFFDRDLKWGAKASGYLDLITREIELGFTPVLIELDLDVEESLLQRCTIIDHHRLWNSGHLPSALQQVTRLIGIGDQHFESNRYWMLIAANDIGHIRGMCQLEPPASEAEIREIRGFDRKCQGLSDTDIQAAAESLNIETASKGALTIATCPHDRTGLVAEAMEPMYGGPGYRNLLVEGENEWSFFGEGRYIRILVEHCEQEAKKNSIDIPFWFGGALPEYGYWGCMKPLEFSPFPVLVEAISNQASS